MIEIDHLERHKKNNKKLQIKIINSNWININMTCFPIILVLQIESELLLLTLITLIKIDHLNNKIFNKIMLIRIKIKNKMKIKLKISQNSCKMWIKINQNTHNKIRINPIKLKPSQYQNSLNKMIIKRKIYQNSCNKMIIKLKIYQNSCKIVEIKIKVQVVLAVNSINHLLKTIITWIVVEIIFIIKIIKRIVI